jgi:hypothetical protein
MDFQAKMVVPRWNHKAISLPDGSVLFVGGLTMVKNPVTMADEIVPVSTLELFSPFDGKFISVGSLDPPAPPVGRIGMSATTLPDGRILITGGKQTINGPPTNEAALAVLDPVDGTIRVLQAHKLKLARTDHQATVLCDGTVLVSGGTLDVGAPYERYNPGIDDRR